jgi:hypothetical protein
MVRRVDNLTAIISQPCWPPRSVTGREVEGMDWIGLTQDRDQCRALVIAVMNLRVAQNAGRFCSGFTTGGLSSSAQLHIVISRAGPCGVLEAGLGCSDGVRMSGVIVIIHYPESRAARLQCKTTFQYESPT